MSRLNRIVLVRHGETEGESSIRFYGSTDVALSDEGRAQMRSVARQIHGEGFGHLVASRLRRAWEAAGIVAPGLPVRLEADFCEVDFGRWEGLTKQEIQAQDPTLYADWQARAEGFAYPEGERQADFQARVLRGLDRLLAEPASSAIVVAHKGVVKQIIQRLTGTELGPGEPPLGGMHQLSRDASGSWRLGRRSSNPTEVGDAPTASTP